MSPDRQMAEKIVVVTGGTGGIGYETALWLARLGAHVVITGRDRTRGGQAADEIRREAGNDDVVFRQTDHSTVAGNQQLAAEIATTLDGIDVLVNNVGGLFDTRSETADGYEATLAMNFVGPAALTAELLPLLESRSPARCINVVSAAFQMFTGDPFEDLQAEQRYVSGDAYARAKLLNVLWTLALARTLRAEQVTVNAVHPGTAWTAMTQATTADTIPSLKLLWPVLRLVQRHGSPAKAAQRVVRLASSTDLNAFTGCFFARAPRPARLSGNAARTEYQEQARRLASELVAAAPTGRRDLVASATQLAGIP